MKTKLAQFVSNLNKIDHRTVYAAYVILAMAVSFALKSPFDGGTGPV